MLGPEGDIFSSSEVLHLTRAASEPDNIPLQNQSLPAGDGAEGPGLL